MAVDTASTKVSSRSGRVLAWNAETWLVHAVQLQVAGASQESQLSDDARLPSGAEIVHLVPASGIVSLSGDLGFRCCATQRW